MCGIAGIAGAGRSRITGLVRALARRGPDAHGVLDVPGLDLALGHTRFAILDLDPRSNQPFESPDGRFALVFNGEIYNYLELRERLAGLGQSFATTSDTEVLLHWLARHGAAGVDQLEGMFAFAFVDRERRTLLAARDPIGEKPFYYAFPRGAHGARFAFASELAPLLALEEVDASIDPEGLADYLRFLYTAAPRTLHRGVRELAPGTLLEVDLADPRERTRRYYDLEARTSEPFVGTREDATAAFRAAFDASVALRLRCDVPIGVYLSGGLDSNAILGTARALAPDTRFHTFTARYDGSRLAREHDESAVAAAAARFQRVPNHSIPFGDEDDVLACARRAVELFGQPFGNATCVVADKVASEAARVSRVCLVGDGGDEILAGYPRYHALRWHRAAARAPRWMRRAAAEVAQLVPERGPSATHARRAKMFLRALAQPMAEAFVDWSSYVDDPSLELALGSRERTAFHSSLVELFQRNASDPLRAAALVDFRSFVPFNLMQAADRTSMAHPIELRCPFLATPLVELALRIPGRHKTAPGRTKPLLVDAVRDRLPPFVVDREKRPFNPPMQGWMRAALPQVGELLLGREARLAGVLDRSFVAREVAMFGAGRRDNSTLLFGLLTLEAWLARSAERAPAPLGPREGARMPRAERGLASPRVPAAR